MEFPAIFMVAPKGSTKDVVVFDTPNSFSQVSIFTGSVASDEAVEKATNCGRIMAFRNFRLLDLLNNFSVNGQKTNIIKKNRTTFSQSRLPTFSKISYP